MRRLLAVALLIILAGCGGAIDGADDREPYEVTEPVEPVANVSTEATASPGENPLDGLSADGISNTGLLVERHRVALEDEPHAVRTSIVVVDANESLVFGREQRLERDAGGDPLSVREYQYGPSLSRLPHSDLPSENDTVLAEHWEDGGTAVSRIETSDGEVERGDGLRRELFVGDAHLGVVSDLGEDSLDTETDDGTVRHVVEATEPAPGSAYLEEEAFEGRIVVSDDGVVERVLLSGTVEEDGEPLGVWFAWQLDRDDVVVEEPEWTDEG